MQWQFFFEGINPFIIILATLTQFILSLVWYSKNVFGFRWAIYNGLTHKQMSEYGDIKKTLGGSALAYFFISYTLALLIKGVNPVSASDAFWVGMLIGFGILLVNHSIHNIYARRPFELTIIDGTYDSLALGIVAMIVFFS